MIARRSMEPASVTDVAVLDRPSRSSLRRRALDVATGTRWVPVATALALAMAVMLRFGSGSAMWLDEAQTVAIAKLPLLKIPGALRHDGAPPLYYVVLHVWMRVFGSGTHAVRALSALFGLATLPVAWAVGRRLGGRAVGWTAMLLLATSPFAVRYSTENRMYALVMLLSLTGFWLVLDILDRPARRTAAALAAVTAAMLLSHYWTFFLVGAGAVLLAYRWRHRAEDRPAIRLALTGLAGGVVVFVPWLPTFAWQTLHTSTPWSTPPTFAAMATAVGNYTGGDTSVGWFLGLTMFVLVILGTFGRPAHSHILLSARPNSRAWPAAATVVTTVAIALAGTLLTSSAIAPRYTSIVFGLWIVLAALGVHTVPNHRSRIWLVAGLVALGLVACVNVDAQDRTQAPEVAAALTQRVAPGDIVAYCPDQLGPAVSRLTGERLVQYTYPRWTSPHLVDWVNYRQTVRKTDPVAFADELDSLAGRGHIWLVWSNAYFGTKASCTAIRTRLASLRPDWVTTMQASSVEYENETLLEFRPSL